MKFLRTQALRDVVDIDECAAVKDVKSIFKELGYPNVWLEDTDQGVVVHGVSVAHNEGGEEVIVPEEWMNR